jgi:phosphomannomutase
LKKGNKMINLVSSVSGLRGIVGDGINTEIIVKYGSAFGVFSGRGKIVIGRDTRPTGEMFSDALSSALEGVGCDVIDLGIVPTPTVLYNVRKLGASGGVIVTASHNPIEWNALKFVTKKGIFLNKKETDEFHNLLDSKKRWVIWNRIGKYKEDRGGIERHIQGILGNKYIKTNLIKKKKFKVVMDTVNGAGYIANNEFLKRLNVEVISINNKPDGTFPRGPEPVSENLKMLSKKVIDVEADMGFAVDPDADRLAIVDEKGKPLGEEYTLPIATYYIMNKVKGNITANLSTSSMMDYVANRFGCKILRSPVGEANVVEEIFKNNSIIGGEGNGGIIFPEINPTRDSLTGIAIILSFFAENNITVSEIRDKIPEKVLYKNKTGLDQINYKKAINNLKRYFKNDYIDERDGIKIITKDNWVHLRKSGTEPIVRIITEGKTITDAKRFYKNIIDILTEG